MHKVRKEQRVPWVRKGRQGLTVLQALKDLGLKLAIVSNAAFRPHSIMPTAVRRRS